MSIERLRKLETDIPKLDATRKAADFAYYEAVGEAEKIRKDFLRGLADAIASAPTAKTFSALGVEMDKPKKPAKPPV